MVRGDDLIKGDGDGFTGGFSPASGGLWGRGIASVSGRVVVDNNIKGLESVACVVLDECASTEVRDDEVLSGTESELRLKDDVQRVCILCRVTLCVEGTRGISGGTRCI